MHGGKTRRSSSRRCASSSAAGRSTSTQTLKAWERGYIEAALRLTRGNVSQAAKLLGINRTTLYSRMQHRTRSK